VMTLDARRRLSGGRAAPLPEMRNLPRTPPRPL
jgi:hypothetical protein